MRPTAASGLLAAALLSTAPALPARGVYKWVDAQGVTHYDDQNLIEGQRLTRAYINQRVIKDVPDWAGMVPPEFAAEVHRQCALIRERLANYRGAAQLYGRDPGGNLYRLSNSQAGLMIAETERDAARWCAPDATRRLFAQRRAELEAAAARP